MLSSQPLERPNSHADPTVFTVLVLRNMALSRVRREILERANFDIEDTWKENGSGKKDVRHLTSQDVVFLCVSLSLNIKSALATPTLRGQKPLSCPRLQIRWTSPKTPPIRNQTQKPRLKVLTTIRTTRAFLRTFQQARPRPRQIPLDCSCLISSQLQHEERPGRPC